MPLLALISRELVGHVLGRTRRVGCPVLVGVMVGPSLAAVWALVRTAVVDSRHRIVVGLGCCYRGFVVIGADGPVQVVSVVSGMLGHYVEVAALVSVCIGNGSGWASCVGFA